MTPSQRVTDAMIQFPIPADRYVLVGSGPMALRDMRDVGDLDVFTTTADWFNLINTYGFRRWTTDSRDPKRRCDPPIASKRLAGIEVNCFFDWRIRDEAIGGNVNVTKLIEGAEFVTGWTSNGKPWGIPCMTLEYLIAWKLEAGREKDYRDIAQIAEFLTRKEIP